MINSFEIIRSSRRTVAIEIKRDMRVIVRAPRRMKTADIERFVESKRLWIERHLAEIRTRSSAQEQPFTENELKAMTEKARESIPPRVEAIAKTMGVSYGRISIRRQKTRWGSASSKGNLNFNCLLTLCPAEVVDYLIIHELCHLRHMNHSAEFWSTVERYCPEHKTHRKWLREQGSGLINRL